MVIVTVSRVSGHAAVAGHAVQFVLHNLDRNIVAEDVVWLLRLFFLRYSIQFGLIPGHIVALHRLVQFLGERLVPEVLPLRILVMVLPDISKGVCFLGHLRPYLAVSFFPAVGHVPPPLVKPPALEPGRAWGIDKDIVFYHRKLAAVGL